MGGFRVWGLESGVWGLELIGFRHKGRSFGFSDKFRRSRVENLTFLRFTLNHNRWACETLAGVNAGSQSHDSHRSWFWAAR